MIIVRLFLPCGDLELFRTLPTPDSAGFVGCIAVCTLKGSNKTPGAQKKRLRFEIGSPAKASSLSMSVPHRLIARCHFRDYSAVNPMTIVRLLCNDGRILELRPGVESQAVFTGLRSNSINHFLKLRPKT